jgi:hypothetical protein
LWQRGHYVSTIAKSFTCYSAFGNGGIPDRRPFSLHTHSDSIIHSKSGVRALVPAASETLGELVRVFRCATSSHRAGGCSATGSAYTNRDDLLSPLLDLPTTKVAANSEYAKDILERW